MTSPSEPTDILPREEVARLLRLYHLTPGESEALARSHLALLARVEELAETIERQRKALDGKDELACDVDRLREALDSIATRGSNRSNPVNQVIACLALGGHVGGKQCDEPQSEVCLHCERCGQHLGDAATAAAEGRES